MSGWWRDGSGRIQPSPDGFWPDGSRIVSYGEGWAVLSPRPDGRLQRVLAVDTDAERFRCEDYARTLSESHLEIERTKAQAAQRSEAQRLEREPVISLNRQLNVWELHTTGPDGQRRLVAQSGDITGLNSLASLPEAAGARIDSPGRSGPTHSTAERMGWTDGVELHQAGPASWTLTAPGGGPAQVFDSREQAARFAEKAGADIIDPPEAHAAPPGPRGAGPAPDALALDVPATPGPEVHADPPGPTMEPEPRLGFGPSAPDGRAMLFEANGLDPNLPFGPGEPARPGQRPPGPGPDPSPGLDLNQRNPNIAPALQDGPALESRRAAEIAARTFPDAADAIERKPPPGPNRPVRDKVLEKVNVLRRGGR